MTTTTTESPRLVTYKVHSNTIPDMIETLDLLEWENGPKPIDTFTDYFTELYGQDVYVWLESETNTVRVEYDF